MKNLIILILGLLILAACSETPQQVDSAQPDNSTILERKKTTTTTPTYTVVYVDSTDWNITSDTSLCGYLILRWTNQNRPTGASNYFFAITPQATGCAGGLFSTTNSLYYQYGWGCSFWTNSTYSVSIRYTWTDSTNAKIFVYTSKAVTVKTGRGTWDCNN